MRTSLLVVLLVLVVGVPAMGAEPLITDPCGDLLVAGHVQGEPVTTPGEQTSGFDIATANITSVAGGVDASLAVCGQAGPPDHNQSYDFGWALGERCDASLRLSRAIKGDLGTEGTTIDHEPHATFEQTCTQPPQNGELFGTGTTVFRIQLPDSAWAVEGNTVTFALRTAELPPAAAALLDPGTVWATPYAGGRYLPASGVGSVFFTDAQGAASIRFSDGADWAGTDQAFVVGS